ncbi:hypothetical protein [Costertonia aggregata]|uniref:Uncharacterized protein n=1 Tax=Costertonia aggregata TaxID=343403 RepID=A0A7H9ANB8_9FLAO|nr:hypothetical protein [Costertonia aggregata]QLG44930.1 hypothetical protein HYG79_06035 [Costertonia aggregata]
MKVFLETMIIVTLAFILTSCKNNNDNGGTNDLESYLTAKIDGVNFSPQFSGGVRTNIAADTITISGNNNDGEQITLLVPANAPFGTHILGALSGTLSTYTAAYDVNDNADDGGELAASGSITITAHDVNGQKINGTFNFVTGPTPSTTIADVFTITEGAFDISYINVEDL